MIVNPWATSVSPRSRARAQAAIEAAHDVTVVDTNARGHAIELAAQGARDGYQAVVVLGGDGTVNEAANGVVGTDVVLAPLPGGSTNVFARTIGVNKGLKKAGPQVAAALGAGASRPFSMGVVNGRRFLFHVGVGFDATVVEQVERRAALKRKLGQAVFVYATFATWLRHFDRKHPHFAVTFPDASTVDDGYYGIYLNTNPYTFFGRRPLNLAPGVGDGPGLAAVTVRTVGIGTLVSLFTSAMGKGRKVRSHPKVDYQGAVESLTVKALGPVGYQVDGDYLGEVGELHFGSEPQALRLLSLG
jgi:diacylglycerol kinase family enzyme